MALTSVASFTVVDANGDKKSVPVYFAQTATVAAVQAAMDDIIASYDAVADAAVVQATLNLSLTLPGGIKSDAISGNTVHEGVLLSFGSDTSVYTYSAFFPAWANAFYNGKVPLAGTELTAIVDAMEDSRDKDGNALTSFLGGLRRTRK